MFESGSLQDRHVLLPLHYFPCIEYFTVFLQAKKVIIESHEHFQKQTLRNRCYVQTANGVEILSVPLLKPTGKVPIQDIRIDNHQLWQKKHWRSLTSAYSNSPFFEFYAPDFHKILHAGGPFLFELNQQLLTLCLNFLKITTEISYNLSYDPKPDYPVFDARSCITDKKNVNRYKFYSPYPYYQTFGNDFSENLSILDLIFNMGPGASEVLKKSTKVP